MRYTWKPSRPDHRDHIFSLSAPSLPDHVDSLATLDPVEDQGQLGSCTGNSSTTALEIVTRSGELSRLMAYYNARSIEGTTKRDAGAEIRDVMKGFQHYGVCAEELWPYVIAKYKTRPNSAAYKAAKGILPAIGAYERVTTLMGLQTALAAGLPVVFGFNVPQEFESQAVAKSGWLPYPSRSAKFVGGHAVCAVGYDTRTNGSPAIRVRNSWGASWGLGGDFWMPFQWFERIDVAGSLVSDCWVIHPAKAAS